MLTEILSTPFSHCCRWCLPLPWRCCLFIVVVVVVSLLMVANYKMAISLMKFALFIFVYIKFCWFVDLLLVFADFIVVVLVFNFCC